MTATLNGKSHDGFCRVTRALLDLDALAADCDSLRLTLKLNGLEPDVVDSIAHGLTDCFRRRTTRRFDDEHLSAHMMRLGVCVGLRIAGDQAREGGENDALPRAHAG